ncbi:MAG: hypothetical protein DRK00_09395 [Thermoprotei archaeon]|nr:MAG: hypothetical protein DRK00_09395 [Thermoprotei archaeon]
MPELRRNGYVGERWRGTTVGKGKVLAVLLLPAVLNFTISSLIAGLAAYQAYTRGLPPEEIGKEVMLALFTYNFYWSILQACFGLLAVKLMGGWRAVKEYYREEVGVRGAALVLLLAAFSQGVIMGFQFLNATLSGGWSAYTAMWREVVSRLPLSSKVYLVAVAPLTAGFFEEIIWRLYGITRLEELWGPRGANLVQALAFAVWHGLSLHTLATFVIGYVYGLVFLKRRKLVVLTAAHVLTDVIGFTAILAV